jgi:hypothetical protein
MTQWAIGNIIIKFPEYCGLRNHKNITFLSKTRIILIRVPEHRLIRTPCNVGFLLPSTDVYFFLRVDVWSLLLPLTYMQ